jgi:putative endonuclease
VTGPLRGSARPAERGARGREAEALAAAFLEAQGYRIVARNHGCRRGEVDLVCRDGETLCFVEVRSRSRRDYGSPEESVTVAKARRVVAAATDWALRHGGLAQPMRFDVVAVDLSGGSPRFTLFRNAFDADGRPT